MSNFKLQMKPDRVPVGSKVRALIYYRARKQDGEEFVAALPGETGTVLDQYRNVLFHRTGHVMPVQFGDVEVLQKDS